MGRKIKVALVSYVNSLPFLYGLENYQPLKEKLEIKLAYPAACAALFNNDEVDIALMPVGALVNTKNYEIFGDFCIGADGYVRTVELLSNVELNNINRIFLDNESATSVRLIKILAKEFWNISPKFLKTTTQNYIQTKEPILAIGDKVFDLEKKYKFNYDLAYEWKKFTNLPFVFALWIAKPKILSFEFKYLFNKALEFGLLNLNLVYKKFKKEIDNYFPQEFNVFDYFEKFISYQFDNQKQKAVDIFLEKIKNLERNKMAII